MSRRSFGHSIYRIAVAAQKAQREAERRQRAVIREHERAMRQAARNLKLMQKEQRVAYLAQREAQTAQMTTEVQNIVSELTTILAAGLKSKKPKVQFESLYDRTSFRPFAPPVPKPVPTVIEPNPDDFLRNTSPGFAEKLLGIGKKSRLRRMDKATEALEQARLTYQSALLEVEQLKQQNGSALSAAKETYEAERAQFEAKKADTNRQVDEFKENYTAGDRDAVEMFNALVLEKESYGGDFPHQFEVLYTPDTKELVVDYDLPDTSVIPQFKEYKFVKTKDEIRGTDFKPKERNDIYTTIVASVTLRALHDLFLSDVGNVLESIVLNGYVRTVDPATGRDIHPCIITVQTTKAGFGSLDLAKVDVIACVKSLKAHLSPALSELAPVKPIVDLTMVDKRFIEERDMISALDDRTNLLEMNPFDFEHLICNLFSKIGLESRLTRSSRDGGVDVIAFDPRPVFGGKYVIQAKRYRNTVEVSAVRDLYGSMMNENAAKGILVTTSSFGPDARSFAKDKPIELIDGSNLLYLLEQQGIGAKIVQPEE